MLDERKSTNSTNIYENLIRRALCPRRVRSCHHPSSHVPGCSFCSFYSFLSIPGAIGSKSVLLDGSLADPWRILGGSLADPRRIPGGLSLWVATYGTLKKRRVLPFDLHLGGARTDQGRQHTHHIPQLMVSWPNFSPHAFFFHILFEKCFPEYTVH